MATDFTRDELAVRVASVRRESLSLSHESRRTLERIQWLAASNYELRFFDKRALSERIRFPVSDNESNGIEREGYVRNVFYSCGSLIHSGQRILPYCHE